MLVFALLTAFTVQHVYGDCGLRMEEDHIVGGKEAEPNSWPWQSSLRPRAWNGNYYHNCGATIINNKWLVTAAHCVDGQTANSLIVVVGDHNKRTLQSETEVAHDLSRIIMHEDYDRNSLNTRGLPHDIALLEVSESIQFNEYVQPACLPNDEEFNFVGNSDCWITGWGYTKGPQDETYLQELNIDVRTNAACKLVWGWRMIHDTHICVGHGQSGACNGDSGGPLVCNVDGQFVLGGVTSWVRSGCKSYGFPSVYTRVSKYLDWIDTNIA